MNGVPEAHLPEGLLAALGQAHAPHVRDDDVDGLVKDGNCKFSVLNMSKMPNMLKLQGGTHDHFNH